MPRLKEESLGTIREFAESIGETFPDVPPHIKDRNEWDLSLERPCRKVWFRGGLAGKGGYHYGIALHATLLECGDSADVRDAFLHELAHVLDQAFHGREMRRRYHRYPHHGHNWLRLALMVGCSGDRTHSYDFIKTRRMERRHEYKCTTCSMTYKRARKLKGDGAYHHCGRCGGRLEPQYVTISDEDLEAILEAAQVKVTK